MAIILNIFASQANTKYGFDCGGVDDDDDVDVLVIDNYLFYQSFTKASNHCCYQE